MKQKEIYQRIGEIESEASKKDHESAHVKEDSLYHDFILYISRLKNNSLSQRAKSILRTKKISFYRYCA